eukprot:CAMPEP_0183709006 /NCGR_PEP_ID=MMETSP0737-20130205/5152_1 /TAXON_ID=385413 /ORGANISM="Thalassiosira miniscula, Strain CCMP1093" /LENGTH=372 /DNA_ID=CAMNT_0025936997 /DNA_START=57 /DNA_END=1172 /DNA_ORIENTATION=+
MVSSESARQTLSTNLMTCLGQEDMTDLHLVGSDGSKIPAFRTILACQSSVLRKMLFGDFAESKSDIVKLGYCGDALRALVEFCITDDVALFDGRVDENAARGIVQLMACAHFLNMELLQDKAQTLAYTILNEHKSMACIIYDEASIFGEPTESVKKDALNIVRANAEETLLSTPRVLRPEILSELIGDDNMMCEEITLFRALNEWAMGEIYVGYPEEDGNDADRVSIAKEIAAKHIRLSSIRPSDLIGIVKKSCIVDEKLIFEALAAQAIFAEKESNLQFSKKRKLPPPGIRVCGAGTDVINGFYEENGEYQGHPKYTRKGNWCGEDRVFVIYRYDSSSWYIAVVAKNGHIGAGPNDFYSALSQDGIPIDGW